MITPIHSSAILVTGSIFSGSLMLNGTVPVADATANVNAPILSLYHSFRFFGRSANITASLPYAAGNFKGAYARFGHDFQNVSVAWQYSWLGRPTTPRSSSEALPSQLVYPCDANCKTSRRSTWRRDEHV